MFLTYFFKVFMLCQTVTKYLTLNNEIKSTLFLDREELGCDPLSSPPPASPPPPPDATLEIQCTEAPLPPFYSLRTAPGQPADGLWCLLQDITNLLQVMSTCTILVPCKSIRFLILVFFIVKV